MLILHNSLINKKLILCYILDRILFAFTQFSNGNITYNSRAELFEWKLVSTTE